MKKKTKIVGLRRDSDHYFQVEVYKLPPREYAVILWKGAQGNFEWGMRVFEDQTLLINGKPLRVSIPMNVALPLFQQSFELYFKALLAFKGFDIQLLASQNKKLREHNLNYCLDKALDYYPNLAVLKEKKEFLYLLQDLGGKNFSRLRYMEVGVTFRHNKIKDPKKSNYAEFEETLRCIQQQLENEIKVNGMKNYDK